jgi:hypothetical protein
MPRGILEHACRAWHEHGVHASGVHACALLHPQLMLHWWWLPARQDNLGRRVFKWHVDAVCHTSCVDLSQCVTCQHVHLVNSPAVLWPRSTAHMWSA